MALKTALSQDLHAHQVMVYRGEHYTVLSADRHRTVPDTTVIRTRDRRGLLVTWMILDDERVNVVAHVDNYARRRWAQRKDNQSR
jgi:hypothetical protein